MKILILGSTGRTGLQLVSQALEKGFEVTALVRDPAKLNIAHQHLNIIKGDVLDEKLMMEIVKGKDAVLSALGVGKSLKSKSLITNASRILIDVMNQQNVQRLIFGSAFGVGETYKQASLIQKLAFNVFLSNLYADKTKADAQIRNSGLFWTIVYPVVLTDKPRKGNYQTGEVLPMKGMPTISRADVAEFMLKQVRDYEFLRKNPIIMN
jgi:putative NADH-flavin reductase